MNIVFLGMRFDDWNISTKSDEFTSLSVRFQVIIEILSALEYIHQRGYIHNDIAPGNVMITNITSNSNPHPIIIDFGAARTVGM